MCRCFFWEGCNARARGGGPVRRRNVNFLRSTLPIWPSESDDIIRRAHVSRSRGQQATASRGHCGLLRSPLRRLRRGGGRSNPSVFWSRFSVGRVPCTGQAVDSIHVFHAVKERAFFTRTGEEEEKWRAQRNRMRCTRGGERWLLLRAEVYTLSQHVLRRGVQPFISTSTH